MAWYDIYIISIQQRKSCVYSENQCYLPTSEAQGFGKRKRAIPSAGCTTMEETALRRSLSN